MDAARSKDCSHGEGETIKMNGFHYDLPPTVALITLRFPAPTRRDSSRVSRSATDQSESKNNLTETFSPRR